MQSDPAPMHGLQPLTPPALEHLVQACLAKDPADRVQSAHDVKLQLNWIAEGGSQAGVPAPTAARRRGRERLAWALIGVLVVVLGILLGQRILVRSEAPPVLRLSVAPPSETTLLNEPVYFSISPDGRYLAMVGADSSGTDRLWIREIGALEPRLLPGTEGALQSFWAPDSRSLCFSTLDRLKRISVDGGSPQVVAPIQQHGRGGSWGPNDTLLIAAAPEGPIYKVSAGGGELTQVTRLDSLETGHRCPHFLPDGRHFLFASLPGKPLYDIYFGDMRTGERKRLFSADGVPEFVEPGLLTYVQNDRIVAQRFDPEQGTLLGDPIAIGDEPAATVMAGKNRFSASRTGTILYIRGRMVNTDLVRTDIAGRRLGTLPCPTGRYTGTRLSPNGDRVALVKRITSSEDELWTYDLARNSALRLTTGSEQIDSPVWSPDGERIAFASNRDGNWNLYLLDAHGRSPAEQIVESSALFKFPWAWSPDGKFLVYAELARETAWDLWVLPLDGAPTPQPYLQTPADENQARFSPDGRWLVFTSTETGRFEVVVRSFPDASQRYTVSQNGGQYPIWTADGTKIYFVSPAGELMVSEVSVSSDGFRATRPRKTGLIASPDFVTADVAPDGSFVLHSLAAEESPGNVPLTVLMNWREHLSDK
jgi:Tol biopolymer transport system component